MTQATKETGQENLELVLDRLLDAPRAAIWRCWTEPALLEQWFVPRPWKVSIEALDQRVGGANRFVMHGPDGEVFANDGIYLDVVPQEKLVFTDAYTSGWQPAAKPFMTVIVTLADEGGKTRYIARARHWTAEDCNAHVEMGFHEGWGKCADQLEELARSL